MALSEWAGPVMLEPELIAGLAVALKSKVSSMDRADRVLRLKWFGNFYPPLLLALAIGFFFQLVEEQSN